MVLLYPQGLILLLITNSVQISNSQGQTQHYRCSERMVFGHVNRSGEVPHPVHSQMAPRTRHLPRDLLPVQISGFVLSSKPHLPTVCSTLSNYHGMRVIDCAFAGNISQCKVGAMHAQGALGLQMELHISFLNLWRKNSFIYTYIYIHIVILK